MGKTFGTTYRLWQALSRFGHASAKVTASILIAALLAGCGGGGEQEPDRVDVPRVDCKEAPSLCV
jgi:hypothetical protein